MWWGHVKIVFCLVILWSYLGARHLKFVTTTICPYFIWNIISEWTITNAWTVWIFEVIFNEFNMYRICTYIINFVIKLMYKSNNNASIYVGIESDAVGEYSLWILLTSSCFFLIFVELISARNSYSWNTMDGKGLRVLLILSSLGNNNVILLYSLTAWTTALWQLPQSGGWPSTGGPGLVSSCTVMFCQLNCRRRHRPACRHTL